MAACRNELCRQAYMWSALAGGAGLLLLLLDLLQHCAAWLWHCQCLCQAMSSTSKYPSPPVQGWLLLRPVVPRHELAPQEPHGDLAGEQVGATLHTQRPVGRLDHQLVDVPPQRVLLLIRLDLRAAPVQRSPGPACAVPRAPTVYIIRTGASHGLHIAAVSVMFDNLHSTESVVNLLASQLLSEQ